MNLPDWIREANYPPNNAESGTLWLNFPAGYEFDVAALVAGLGVALSRVRSLTISYADVSNESISALALAAQQGKLQQLRSLDLRQTLVNDESIRELGIAAQEGCLQQLESLYLHPSSVSIESIRGLAMAFQQGQLPKIETVWFENTEFAFPEALREEGNSEEFFAYILEQQSGQNEKSDQFKLLLLGQGTVGKTHLRKNLERLRDGELPTYYERSEDRTQGIDMSTLRVRATDRQRQLTANTWDFGGQNYLHATHRFFLTQQHSLYVLVLDVTRHPNGEDEPHGGGKSLSSNRLAYWMGVIRHYGGVDVKKNRQTTPMLVVLTHCDAAEYNSTGDPAGAYVANLEALEPYIRSGMLAEQNIITGVGWNEGLDSPLSPRGNRDVTLKRHTDALKQLQTRIAKVVSHLPGMDEKIPKSYFAVRNWVAETFALGKRDDGVKYFNYTNEAFRRLLAEHDINEHLRNAYLTILHSNGLIHWLGDRPDVNLNDDRAHLGRRVFNPDWVTGPVYELIWARTEIPWLSHEDIRERLPDSPPDMASKRLFQRLPFVEEDRNNIISLMKACGIAFEVKSGRHADGVLIPDALNPNPEDIVGLRADQLSRFELEADFVPERLFTRLIAEHYPHVETPAAHLYRNQILYLETLGRYPDTCVRIWLRTELSPPTGIPKLHLAVDCEVKAARNAAVDKVLDELNGMMHHEGLAGLRLVQVAADIHGVSTQDKPISASHALTDEDVERLNRIASLFNAAGLKIASRDLKYVRELFLQSAAIPQDTGRTGFRAAYFYWHIVNQLLIVVGEKPLTWGQISSKMTPEVWGYFGIPTSAPTGQLSKALSRTQKQRSTLLSLKDWFEKLP